MQWMLMPLKRYAEFSGRSRRKEYWMFFLGVVLLYLALALLMLALMGPAISRALGADATGEAPGSGMMGAMLGGGIVGILIVLVWLLLLIPSIAVGVRRLHDIDRTGWWLMLGYGPSILSMALELAQSEARVALTAILDLVSLIGFIVVLVFAVLPGTKGGNRFGPDPKGEDLGEVFA